LPAPITEASSWSVFLGSLFGDASIEEWSMLFRQSIAYAGPYPLVNDAVIHHVPVAADPTWTGVDQMQYLQFEVERLIIATPVFVLEWRKITD
jgi:hypothetical protein